MTDCFRRPYVDLTRSPAGALGLAGVAPLWTPQGARSSSPVDAGGTGAPCGAPVAASVAAVGPAEVEPNFLSARLNPGEAAAVLCKKR